MIAGPFGALWGAQLGSSIGAGQAQQRAAEKRLGAMGITPEMLRDARELAAQVAEAEQGLDLAQRAVDSSVGLETALREQAGVAYKSAEAALRDGDEAAARSKLEEKQRLLLKAQATEAETLDAREREASMASSLATLRASCTRLEQSIQQQSMSSGQAASYELEPSDPLLDKFKHLES